MVRLLFLLLLLFCRLSLSGVPAVSGGRPDSAVLREIRNSFPGWKLNSSARCAVARGNGLWAWKIVLERQIDSNIKSSFARDGKGYIIIVIVPDAGIDPGRNFISVFDWNIPGNDLKQFTVFLGRGRGYYWYMKSDIARLNFFREKMRLSGGEDMDRLMADALNVADFDLFTSRAAVEYFRNRGPRAVPLIMKSMEEWRKEEKNPPIQHMIALKLTGSSAAAEELVKLAYLPDHAVAHQALKLLTEAPYLAADSFYLRALAVPEYTGKIIRIFRERKKTDLILPRLRKLVKAPRSFQQYSEVLAALRELESPGKTVEIPEYAACNDIMFLMMRMGETPDTIKYVPIEAEGAGSPTKLAEEERKRIEPHLEILRKSKDPEAVFAAAVALAAYSPDSKAVAREYSSRVRRIGVEILRMLPADFVFARFDMLAKSLVVPREQSLLRMIRHEYGGR